MFWKEVARTAIADCFARAEDLSPSCGKISLKTIDRPRSTRRSSCLARSKSVARNGRLQSFSKKSRRKIKSRTDRISYSARRARSEPPPLSSLAVSSRLRPVFTRLRIDHSSSASAETRRCRVPSSPGALRTFVRPPTSLDRPNLHRHGLERVGLAPPLGPVDAVLVPTPVTARPEKRTNATSPTGFASRYNRYFCFKASVGNLTQRPLFCDVLSKGHVGQFGVQGKIPT